jgi:ATP-dependent exoDNAse (exonuclease V) alpha subunit
VGSARAPAIDHGYATTSYRSQSRTVDAVFALASSAEARRGLYVDVTRARKT